MTPVAGTPRRIVVAPDKFKGTLTAGEAARAIADGLASSLPEAEFRLVPLADGGEGSVDAAVAAGALRRSTVVEDPLGEPVLAAWAETSDDGVPTAVVEVAAASGLALVDPTPGTARRADTSGTGQLLLAALDAGVRRVVLGVGGTAGTDGGTGLLRALGVRFLDRDGCPVPRGAAGLPAVATVDLSGLDPRCTDLDVLLCCDVEAPLLGEHGAARVFGPQKGAGPREVAQFEEGLRRLADALRAATGVDVVTWPWAGAGGAVSAGAHAVLGARAVSGADHVAGLVGLDAHLAWADLLVVGEGSLDAQSLAGKAPVAAARRARAAGVPVVAVAGRLDVPEEDLRTAGFDAVVSAVGAADARDAPAGAALVDAAHWVARAAGDLATRLVDRAVTVSG